MSTRSITIVTDEKDKQIMVMYRHCDGYPQGHGIQLAKFLLSKNLVIGIPCGSDARRLANGVECLAAQMVAHFKGGFHYDNPDDEWQKEKYGKIEAGGIYLYPADGSGYGEEYTYTVKPQDDSFIIVGQGEFGDEFASKVVFTAQEFLDEFGGDND